MEKPWKKILENIKPYKPGRPIEEVKRELALSDVVKLASNENPFPPSPLVIKALAGAAKDANRYPDGGCFYLRNALSKKLGIPGENIVFGNGSDEIIVMALHAFVEPGDEVVVADPTFLIYNIASMVRGAVVRSVPLKDYRYDLEAMAKAVTAKTKVVFIANPDNPTGSYVTKAELDSFLGRIPESVVVFLDEAYYEFAAGGDYPETLDMAVRGTRHIITARTFSKVYGLAGLRVGYGITRSDIAEVLNKVREPFNVNSLAQVAAAAALEDAEYVKRSISLVKTEKEKYYRFFDSLGIKYVPSRANFVLFDTGRDSVKVFEFLLKKGVITREMTAWGLKGFVRVNMGLPEENEKFFGAFREAVKAVPVTRN